MPIQSPTVTPVVQLPVTGVDPTAASPVVTAVAVAPQLSAHDQALIAQTQAQFAGNAQPAVTAGDAAPAVAATANAGDTGNATATAGAATPSSGASDTQASANTSPDAGSGDGASQPEPELTASQKIAAKIASKKAQIVKLTGEIERLEGQFRSADLLDSVKAGSVIKARVGRAETAREVTASVTGVQQLEGGDVRYKIFFGEGFDAETIVIQPSQIVDVVQV
ncbi:hypothetical protein VAC51_00029 [Variovorax phage VAC_51]|uniref:Uncharacterized protein n=1 Tax=Variovorax phage VAC_51 TaxID=2985242 RepID=A0A9N6WSC3_9CAUD|nr:hypothetical protein VAC51_00029 [Variovorax phage VAC_51]